LKLFIAIQAEHCCAGFDQIAFFHQYLIDTRW
jgi:hypothetical protein